MILAGDFNAPDINWPNLDSYLTSPSERLLEMIDEHDLKQLVESPTRRQGNTQNILDLVSTNNARIVSGIEVVPGISDHEMVLFSVKISCRKKRNVKRKVYIKRKANCRRIKEMLIEFSDSLMENLREFSVDEMWDTFERSIRSIMDACIPHKMTSSRYNLPWFNRSLRRQSRAKQRLYNKAKRSQKNIGVSSEMLENAYTRNSSLQERDMSLVLSVSQLKITQSAFGRLLKISK